MEVDKSEWKVLQQALAEWEQTGKLTADKARELQESIAVKQNDRQQIAQYFFFIALFCTLMAFGAIFINEKLLEKIKLYFSWNDLAITGITAVLSVLWFWYTGKKRNTISPAVYEIYMSLGGLAVLTSLLYMCKEMGLDKTYTAFLSLSLPLLGVLAVLLRSRALWIGTIIIAISWFGSFSVWQSTGNLFWGMNYPVRYALFGLVLLGAAYAQGLVRPLAFTRHVTYTTGLLLLFLALWAVSIFGNYDTLAGWQQVRQIHVVAYSVVFGLASAIVFYLGIRFKDDFARDISIVFLLINLYTRYFEYFWDAMNKGIFFIILAVTFGIVGRWLEKKKHPGKKVQKVSEP